MSALQNTISEFERITDLRYFGRVSAVLGMLVEIGGATIEFSIGDRCEIAASDGRKVLCEVIGFREGRALLMSYHALEGVGLGCPATRVRSHSVIQPDPGWLGRVINGAGEPLDGKGPLSRGHVAMPLRNRPPPAHRRQRVSGKVDLGVRALNTFLTCCRGQRMGIFAASGVGKSVLLSMIARYTDSEVNVIGLIGERGREVQEFIHKDLGEEGMARSVVVVATSDESPLMRRQAADLTMATAEYFRDHQDRHVLCMIDSVTRIAMAQREIGLSVGEPPASKGYTPTVFSELPKLMERAGPGIGPGTITGLFTVLVEGDDHDEPISDALRGILDGHIVLERSIAERGRFPAINILRSASRTMPDCNSDEENVLIRKARALMADYSDMEELIRLGAYRAGSNAKIDEAIKYHDDLEHFLNQFQNEQSDLASGYTQLASIFQDEEN